MEGEKERVKMEKENSRKFGNNLVLREKRMEIAEMYEQKEESKTKLLFVFLAFFAPQKQEILFFFLCRFIASHQSSQIKLVSEGGGGEEREKKREKLKEIRWGYKR